MTSAADDPATHGSNAIGSRTANVTHEPDVWSIQHQQDQCGATHRVPETQLSCHCKMGISSTFR